MKLLISAIYDQDSPLDYIFDGRINTVSPDVLFKTKDVAALVLWGGEDIATGIYGQKASEFTDSQEELSKRDIIELSLANAAIKKDIPIIGVCRGAQLMCARSGGTIIQHVDHHAGFSHPVKTFDGETFMTNSVHHQMMNPFQPQVGVDKVEYEMLAWSSKPLSQLYIGEEGKHIPNIPKEPEIVWFPSTKSLCIQGHPEYMTATPEFIRYTYKLIKKYILQPEPISNAANQDSPA